MTGHGLKVLRLTLGAVLFLGGLVLTLLPGSILLVIGGLLLMSYDWPRARSWLMFFQRQMSRSARRLDQILLNRKLRKARIR
ncbi:tellurium resistance protein TerC [Alteromonas gilva]|uniref:Tellurium resistance protein TerC n=1 Tax=Alteromonas gilva TaxID=2987522 RepID=A0ABT5L2X0_9ALTE|nr:tellurium resistance protein TerC [Alteromonas gilva]MDC8830831.1 tellurium resistance protein TerC [Alteromonas gilva]